MTVLVKDGRYSEEELNTYPYQATAPKMYALTVVSGRDAMALCQYA